MTPLIVKILLTCLAAYCIILVLAYFLQEKMMFFPSGEFGKCPQAEHMEVSAVEAGNLRFYIRKADRPELCMVFFHGNAGSACDRMYFIEMFKDLPADLVVFEYPGYGGDPRKPGENMILEEALALIKHLQSTFSEKTPVFLAGESLGCGVVTYLAGQTRVKGLILISPYTSIVDVAAAHYPFLPVRLLARNRFPAGEWAQNVKDPAIAFHGKIDTIIPIRFARQQMENFQQEAQLVEIENTGHNDILVNGRELIRSRVKQFIRNHTAGTNRYSGNSREYF